MDKMSNTCLICQEDEVDMQYVLLPSDSFDKKICFHVACVNCMDSWITVKVMQEGERNIQCPHSECDLIMHGDDVQRMTSDPNVFRTFQKLTHIMHAKQVYDDVQTKMLQDKLVQACPVCNILVSRSSGCNSMRCSCGECFCFHCGFTLCGGNDTRVGLQTSYECVQCQAFNSKGKYCRECKSVRTLPYDT